MIDLTKTLSLRDARELSREFAEARDRRLQAARIIAAGGGGRYGQVRIDSAKSDAEAYLKALAIDWALAMDKTRARVDSFAPMAFDALTSAYQEIYKVEHRPLDATLMFPAQSGGHSAAAEDIAVYESDIIGGAQVGNSYSSDIPLVAGPVMSEFRQPVIPFMVAGERNFMDDRRLSLARQNNAPAVDTWESKTAAAAQSIAAAKNAMWLYGSTIAGIDGIFGNPNIPVMQPSPGPWSTLTADQLTDELSKLFNHIPDRMFNGGDDAMRRVKLFLPPAALRRIRDVKIPNTGISVWVSFRDSYGLRDEQLVAVYSLDPANSTLLPGGVSGLSAATALVKMDMGDQWDPYLLETQPLEIPVPTQINGINERTIWHSRAGGLVVVDARRVATCSGL